MASAPDALPGLRDVEAARERLAGIAIQTPLLPIDAPPLAGVQVKCECLQRTGSFKLRGLYHRVATLPPEVRERGVVTLSAGNAGAAVAWAARAFGVPCAVVLPGDGVARKRRLIEALGAETHPVQERERLEAEVERLVARRGLTFVHSYDDPAVIAGQGTIALEVLDQLADLDVLLVPTGGGGMLAGCSLVLRERAPGMRLIAAEAEGAATLAPSLAAGHVITRPHVATIADGLATSTYGELTFTLVRDVVDDVVTVDEDEILRAMAFAWEQLRLAIEPAAAVALAAALALGARLRGQRVAVVLSGGNVEPSLLADATTVPQRSPDLRRVRVAGAEGPP